jgi:hypothetical protein
VPEAALSYFISPFVKRPLTGACQAGQGTEFGEELTRQDGITGADYEANGVQFR